MSVTPSALAQAIAVAAGNNMAALPSPNTVYQTSIAGGNLSPAALFDALQTFTSYAEVLGGVGFQNGWGNFGAGPNTAAFMKDALGFVNVRGAISLGTVNLRAFTFPVGFRPGNTVAFATTSNNAFGSIVVDSAGNLVPNVGSNVFFYLDCVRFFAVG